MDVLAAIALATETPADKIREDLIKTKA